MAPDIQPFIKRIGVAPRRGAFAMEGFWVWCGSVIAGDDGKFHMYAARWPRDLPFFEGYTVASEVVHATSATPEGPYQFESVVLPDRGEEFWDGRMTHNPTVIRWGDSYCLLYIGATFAGARPDGDALRSGASDVPDRSYSTIRIGMAVADSPVGPWVRSDVPVLDVRPDHWDSTVTTNPAPCLCPDGSLLLCYRSNINGVGCRLGMAKSPAVGEPFSRVVEGPILGNMHIEDPFIWWVDDHYEMVAKDLSGKVTGELHAGVHAWSHDGLSWSACDPPKAFSRTVRWDDGSSSCQGSLERPQLLMQDGVPTHLFAATSDGPGGFRNASNTWNMVIPLA